MPVKSTIAASVIAGAVLLAVSAFPQSTSFRFVVLGDRTGETQGAVYERVWQGIAAEKPAFVVSVGDTIQGAQDDLAESEWEQVEKVLLPWKHLPLYLAPGNHDIWSDRSEQLFRKHSGHGLHYSFDYRQAHFTILDNSRAEQFALSELAFLEADLKEHQTQPLKFIVSHRPSWIINAMLDDPKFELHRIARKYGVRFILAGHIHEMLHADLDGISYISMVSSGAHLRGAGKYEDGWFFGYATVDVTGAGAAFQIHELGDPDGQGRVTPLSDWGKAGLLSAQ